jgi:hypothetical protein
MTFCGPARDMVLTNRQTEKLNFDTNYITIKIIAIKIIAPVMTSGGQPPLDGQQRRFLVQKIQHLLTGQ